MINLSSQVGGIGGRLGWVIPLFVTPKQFFPYIVYYQCLTYYIEYEHIIDLDGCRIIVTFSWMGTESLLKNIGYIWCHIFVTPHQAVFPLYSILPVQLTILSMSTLLTWMGAESLLHFLGWVQNHCWKTMCIYSVTYIWCHGCHGCQGLGRDLFFLDFGGIFI